jgi:protein-S-isoprenylcysteine O-methyltransferase Ste14
VTARPAAAAAIVGYGALAYAAFLAVSIYLILFLAGAAVPKGIDDGPAGPAWLAVLVDVVLLAAFAVQHSVMARPWFKRAWTRVVAPPIERSTYVLLASGVLALLAWQWRPLPATVWSVDPGWARTTLWAGYASGWVVLVVSTFLVGHLELFGLQQVVLRARNRMTPTPAFREPLIYRIVRHPLMVGFLIAFWSTPDMSVGRLLLAAGATGYILVAVRFEEHDLRRELGDPYERYMERVPRFVPAIEGRSSWPAGARRRRALATRAPRSRSGRRASGGGGRRRGRAGRPGDGPGRGGRRGAARRS